MLLLLKFVRFSQVWSVLLKLLGAFAWVICASQANFALFFLMGNPGLFGAAWYLVSTAGGAFLVARLFSARLNWPLASGFALVFSLLCGLAAGLLLHVHPSTVLWLVFAGFGASLIEVGLQMFPAPAPSVWQKLGLVLCALTIGFSLSAEVDSVVKFALVCLPVVMGSALYHWTPERHLQGLYNRTSVVALSILACAAVMLAVQDLRWEKILFAVGAVCAMGGCALKMR